MLSMYDYKTFVPDGSLNAPVPEFRDGTYSITGRTGDGMAAHILHYKLNGEKSLCFRVRAFVDREVSADCFGVIVNWFDKQNRVTERDYLDRKRFDLFERTIPVPAESVFFSLELFSRWTFADVTFGVPEIESVKQGVRKVRLVTTKLNPPPESSEVQNLNLLSALFDRIEKEVISPDIVLLPENLNTRNVRGSVCEKVQPVSGPYAAFLSAAAKRLNSYIVTTFAEAEDGRFYNTALLFGRDGEIAGKYRKVHLTLSEAEAGFFPGKEFPVFALDCAKVGISTCWDNWFPESMRMLSLNGAEIVLFPLAGDGDPLHWEHVWRARAMDNGVYLAASISQGEAKEPVPARVIRPDGSVCAETYENPGYAVAEIDLNERFMTYWLSVGPALGEGASLYRMERRPETYLR